MRRAGLLLVAALLLPGACREPRPTVPSPEPRPPSPSPSPEEPGTPAALPGASCDDRGGGSFDNTPDFVEVRVESEDGVDRVSFLFAPRNPDTTQPPSHYVRFVDELVEDPEGVPADVAGEAFVHISFTAIGVDLSGEEPREIYTGPRELTPGFPTVVEVEELGDFEAVVSWGIGLSRRECFVLEASPTEITLAFPSR